MGRVTVLACGEPMRGDDAAAVLAMAAISPDAARLAEVRLVGQLNAEDLLDAPEPVIVVDAVNGPPPGEVLEIPLTELAAGGLPGHAVSSHALPLATAVALAAQLRRSAPQGRFVGVAGAGYGLGTDLSDPVRRAMPQFTRAIELAIRELAADAGEWPHGTDGSSPIRGPSALR